MMFRDVLPATIDELRKRATFNPGHEVTVVRDVEGRIRLIVGTRNPAAAPLPDAQAQQALAAALSTRLGRWVGTQPIWLDDAPPQKASRPEKRAAHLALDLARRSRVSAPWSPQPGDPTWYLLERHAAKRTWVGEVQPQPPWPTDEVDRGQRPPVITFFSHKGGVGRTTALVATALHLARANQQVALVDLDIEAPGLSSLLLQKAPAAGALDYLVEANIAAGTTALDVTEYVSDTALVGSGSGLQVVQAGKVDEAFLEMVRDGKAPRPLLLVHGMAPPAADPRYALETESFRTKAYDELSDNYYPPGQIPTAQASDEPHWPVVVPWMTELRGGGGLLTPPVVKVLLGESYRELTERLGKLFGRPLQWRTHP